MHASSIGLAMVSEPRHFVVEPFAALTGAEVHDVLALRAHVFVVEQRCAYADPDGRDPSAHHLLGRDDEGRLGVYARIFVGEGDAAHRIGRVVVHPALRGRGLGRALMREAIGWLEARGPRAIELAAQAHLEAFYGSLGFVRTSERYDEDGIPHVDMRRVG